MNILNKIWAIIKSLFAALSKEPENNQLDVGIPSSEDEVSTVPVDEIAPEPVPAPEVQGEIPVSEPTQSN